MLVVELAEMERGIMVVLAEIQELLEEMMVGLLIQTGEEEQEDLMDLQL